MLLLIPLHRNRDPVICQFDGLAPIQLHDHRILQAIDDFGGYSLVKDIDNNGAADVSGETLNGDILDAFDFVCYVYW